MGTLEHANSQYIKEYRALEKGTSRQRSGKGAIRKRHHSKNRGGKKVINNKVLLP